VPAAHLGRPCEVGHDGGDWSMTRRTSIGYSV
jgi:hypothetical protein